MTYTYDLHLGICLNRKRLNKLKVYLIAAGASIANSNEDLESDIFDAIEDTEQEAIELEFRTNADRRLARVKARKGMI